MNQLLDKLSQIWPDWKIVEKIGEGSFGEVYKAVRRDFAGTTWSAIKAICIPKDEEEIEELKAEGYSLDQSYTYFRQVVKDYTHEIRLMDSVKGYTNVVSIDDYKIVESDDEMLWYIFIRMELLTPLVKKAAVDEITEPEVIRAGIDLCSALDVCRKKNIVHRDIKPQNIFVNDEGNYKLGDFGVARSLNRTTNNLSKKGAPNYMAPELYNSALRETNIDDAAKVDIYSLGLVLYWMGNRSKLPFLPTDKQIATPEDRERAFIRRISGEALPGPAQVSPELQRIILKACAYKPEDRYASAEEMKKDLIRLRDGESVPPQPPQPPQPKNLWKLLCLILVIFATVILLLYLIPTPGEDSYLIKIYNAVISTPIPTQTPGETPTPTSKEPSTKTPRYIAADTSTQEILSTATPTPIQAILATATSTTTPIPTPTKIPAPTPTPTETPVINEGEMINRYGITNAGNQAVRRQPDENGDNILTRLDRAQHVYLLRADFNDAGESWTFVEWKTGEYGYIRTEYLNLLTQTDSEAWDSAQETPAPIYPTIPTPTPTPVSVPKLTDLYPGSTTRLHEFASSRTNERITTYAGPGAEYGKAVKVAPSSQKSVTAYYAESDWVFTKMILRGDLLYVYVPRKYFDYLDNVPEIKALEGVTGTVRINEVPRWGPSEEYKKAEDCSATKGTLVKAFFTNGQYTYCEYSCSAGTVRMWLPSDAVTLTGD